MRCRDVERTRKHERKREVVKSGRMREREVIKGQSKIKFGGVNMCG